MIESILNLLRSDGYITVNKTLVKKIGLSSTVLYSELISKYKYFKDMGKLQNGFFYCTIDDMYENTGIKKDEQEGCIKNLAKLGLLEKKVMKLKGDEAPKRYFRIIDDVTIIINLLSDEVKKEPVSVENTEIAKNRISTYQEKNNELLNSAPNKNNIYNNKLNNNNQSVSQDPIAQPDINSIMESASIDLYPEDKQQLIVQTLEDMYYSDDFAKKNKIPHDVVKARLHKIKPAAIDRALFKFQEYDENEDTKISSPLRYFEKILWNSITESLL